MKEQREGINRAIERQDLGAHFVSVPLLGRQPLCLACSQRLVRRPSSAQGRWPAPLDRPSRRCNSSRPPISGQAVAHNAAAASVVLPQPRGCSFAAHSHGSFMPKEYAGLLRPAPGWRHIGRVVMAARFQCPGCGTAYFVTDDMAGKSINCRQCDARGQVQAGPLPAGPAGPSRRSVLWTGAAAVAVMAVGGTVAALMPRNLHPTPRPRPAPPERSSDAADDAQAGAAAGNGLGRRGRGRGRVRRGGQNAQAGQPPAGPPPQ